MRQTIKQRAQSIYGNEPETMDQLGDCLVKMIDNYVAVRSKIHYNAKCIGLSWELTHSMQISNTHHAPQGKVTNWGFDHPELPKGYPGWTGRVWVRYDTKLSHIMFGSDPFEGTLTYTGTGGYGGYDGPWENLISLWHRHRSDFHELQVYSWDFKIFDDDWPLITEIKEHISLSVFNRLADITLTTLNHTFLWEDPETKKNDRKIMNSFKNS
jgi:hypothetical protein